MGKRSLEITSILVIVLAISLLFIIRFSITNAVFIMLLILTAVILGGLLVFLLLRSGKTWPRWVSVILIVCSFVGIGMLVYPLLKTNKGKLASVGNEQEQKFIEIFNALEVNNQNLLNESDQSPYLDYIIQKYQLWKRDQIKNYKQQRDLLSIEEERWHELLLIAQDYQTDTGWESGFKKNEKDNQATYLGFLEKTDPGDYKLLQTLKDKDENNAKEAYQTLNPGKLFPKEKWEENNEEFFNNAVRSSMREQFKKEFAIK